MWSVLLMLATAVLLVYANVDTEEMLCTVWLSLRLRLVDDHMEADGNGVIPAAVEF
jgi:hypothetical protein